jgi:cobalamin biosynthesis Co2+ chelatase CbiK
MYNTPTKLKLDIIIIGYEEDKEKIRPVIEHLQEQLNKINNKEVSVLFGFGTKEPNNIDEIKGRLKTMTNCEYFVFLDLTESFLVMPNYIESLLQIIKENESTELGQEIIAINGINKWQ